jgi:hypothetical protein
VDARKWVASKLKPKVYGDKALIGEDPDNRFVGLTVTVKRDG